MGLDTCTLVAVRYNVPIEISVFDITDKRITRGILNRLQMIATANNILTDPRHMHKRVYEIDETIIEKINEYSILRDADIAHTVSMIFSDFKRGISYDELIRQDPLNGKPMSKMLDGMRFFILFEG